MGHVVSREAIVLDVCARSNMNDVVSPLRSMKTGTHCLATE